MIAVPIVILLLAFAGANWRTFHLAYCKNLMGSSDYRKRLGGLTKLVNVHFRSGMSREEVARMLLPLQLQEGKHGYFPEGLFVREQARSGAVEMTWTLSLRFDHGENLDGLNISSSQRRVPRKGDDSISVGGGGGVTVNPGADGRFRIHEAWFHAGE